MSDSNTNFNYFWAVVIAGVFIVSLSLLPIPINGPKPWVNEWTVWLASYIGIGVSARGLWVISDAIAKRIKQ
jgi:hypothetical protein